MGAGLSRSKESKTVIQLENVEREILKYELKKQCLEQNRVKVIQNVTAFLITIQLGLVCIYTRSSLTFSEQVLWLCLLFILPVFTVYIRALLQWWYKERTCYVYRKLEECYYQKHELLKTLMVRDLTAQMGPQASSSEMTLQRHSWVPNNTPEPISPPRRSISTNTAAMPRCYCKHRSKKNYMNACDSDLNFNPVLKTPRPYYIENKNQQFETNFHTMQLDQDNFEHEQHCPHHHHHHQGHHHHHDYQYQRDMDDTLQAHNDTGDDQSVSNEISLLSNNQGEEDCSEALALRQQQRHSAKRLLKKSDRRC